MSQALGPRGCPVDSCSEDHVPPRKQPQELRHAVHGLEVGVLEMCCNSVASRYAFRNHDADHGDYCVLGDGESTFVMR